MRGHLVGRYACGPWRTRLWDFWCETSCKVAWAVQLYCTEKKEGAKTVTHCESLAVHN